jgi:GNAT superfamily N-acetyltransferase
MPSTSSLRLRHHNATETLHNREALLAVYAAANADRMGDPWFHPNQFWQRLVDLYAPSRDFELVTGWIDDQMVGYAFGSPRDQTQSTWNTIHALMPDLQAGGSIYIFREFAVHPDHQRHGYGRQIHDALLATRSEPVAHLLVLPDNIPARTAYQNWGWIRIGTLQPFPDAPVCEEMILVLPGSPAPIRSTIQKWIDTAGCHSG